MRKPRTWMIQANLKTHCDECGEALSRTIFGWLHHSLVFCSEECRKDKFCYFIACGIPTEQPEEWEGERK